MSNVMPNLKSISPKADHPAVRRPYVPEPRKNAIQSRKPVDDRKQRGLMVGSLCLLLLALGIVLWHDRDFWFPDSPEAESEQVESSPVTAQSAPVQAPVTSSRISLESKPVHRSRVASKSAAQSARSTTKSAAVAAPASAQPSAPTIARTVLPPLEVEVVAGDTHRVIRPGSNSMRVDLQPGAPPQPSSDAAVNETAAGVTTNAAERLNLSPDVSQIVSASVRPDYPMLARQMKVQGSVVLHALIGRDGIIQNLSLVSGPHILASAAENAVRQWHFKPHFEGKEAVETQAKITVNFTISTN